MNISKNSWHYRLIRWTDGWPQTNLCPYMRQVVGRLLALPTIGILSIGLAVIATIPLWHWFFSWLPEVFIPLGIASILINAMIATGVIREYREDWQYNVGDTDKYNAWYHKDLLAWVPQRKPKPYSGPSAFAEWKRATHDQICPSIDFRE